MTFPSFRSCQNLMRSIDLSFGNSSQIAMIEMAAISQWFVSAEEHLMVY